MVSNAFKRCARDVGQRAAARQAGDAAAGIGLPVRRAQAREGRHQHHAAGIRHALRQRFDFAAAADSAQSIAQPLHHRATYKHAAFQSELRLGAGLRCAGGQQAVVRGLECAARVHQHEAAGAVGVFGHAGSKAGLTEERALLVTRDTANRHGRTQQFGRGLAELRARRQHVRHQAGRNVQ